MRVYTYTFRNSYREYYTKTENGIKYSPIKKMMDGLLHIRISAENPPKWRWFNKIKDASIVLLTKGASHWYNICAPDDNDNDRILVKAVFLRELSGMDERSKKETTRKNGVRICYLAGEASIIDEYETQWNWSCESSHGLGTIKYGTMFKRETLLIINSDSEILLRHSLFDDVVLINSSGRLTTKSVRDYYDEKIPINQALV